MSRKNGKQGGTDLQRGQGFQPGNKLSVGTVGARVNSYNVNRMCVDALRMALNVELKAPDGTTKKRVRIIAEAVADKACRGDMEAVNFIYDRVDGPIVQRKVVDGQVEVNHSYDMSRLTPAQRAEFERLAQASLVIDVEAEEVESEDA